MVELVLNVFYVACFAMIWMYFFNIRVNTHQFNYWCSLSMGITVLLRDVLCPPPLANLPMRSVRLHAGGAAALHADLLLCPPRVESLHEEQPVDYLRRRCAHCCHLPSGHHVFRAGGRVHQLLPHRDMDTSYYRLRLGGMLRDGYGRG